MGVAATTKNIVTTAEALEVLVVAALLLEEVPAVVLEAEVEVETLAEAVEAATTMREKCLLNLEIHARVVAP
ncbi:MAG: hypothetical protein NC548_34070 [Lachnospiraceae bacterium]|nr:hypothetical protein [Lachnospiraceae bacterium]